MHFVGSISGCDTGLDNWFPVHSWCYADFVSLCCRIIPNVAALKIKREKISKQDVAFMKKVKKSKFL